MKTIRLLAAALLCAAMPSAMNAQENLKQAIENFINNKELDGHLKKSNSLENYDNDGVKTMSYYNYYSFDIPKSKHKELDKVLDAFKKDVGEAYKVQTKDAGMDASILSNVAYGENLDKSITFGTHEEKNYRLMFVRDRQDSLRRYVYAITWAEPEYDDNVYGSITEIYSPDPQLQGIASQDSQQQEGMTRYMTLEPDGSISVTDRNEDLVLETSIPAESDIQNSTDFIKRFTTLRTTYLSPKLSGQNENVIKTALINKIVELCSKHGKLLNNTERETCTKALKYMLSSTNDPYDRDLLKLAMSSLDK